MSVTSPDAPRFPFGFLDRCVERHIPVLGICYGLQLLVQGMGGKVQPSGCAGGEYGRTAIDTTEGSALFSGEGCGGRQTVWMSHFDEVVALPEGFKAVAKSEQVAKATSQMSERPVCDKVALKGASASLRWSLLAADPMGKDDRWIQRKKPCKDSG